MIPYYFKRSECSCGADAAPGFGGCVSCHNKREMDGDNGHTIRALVHDWGMKGVMRGQRKGGMPNHISLNERRYILANQKGENHF